MSRAFDSVVIGASADGLVAAAVLARAGQRVLVLEAEREPGGTLRAIEFAPGYRAAPLAGDLGHVHEDVLRATGTVLPAKVVPDDCAVALGDGGVLTIGRTPAATAEGLRRHSAKDAAAWPAFAAGMHAIAGFLGELYRRPAFALDATGGRELLSLAGLGMRYRALGRRGMAELLRTLPIALADLLDDWFEDVRLKGLLAAIGTADLPQGPMAGGTALALLHRQVGAAPGAFGDRLRLQAGGTALVTALAERARAGGALIETGAEVRRILVHDDRVAGVVLASGEEIACRRVISGAGVGRTLLELLDTAHLDTEFIDAVRNIRHRGVTSFVLLGLDGLPAIPGHAGPPAGSYWIAPSVRDVERAHDDAKYGRISSEPVIELRFPSVTQPDLAPPGRHVAVLRVQYTPWRLREGDWSSARDAMARRAIAAVERQLPGFTARIAQQSVLAPPDLEARFGLPEGAVSRGEVALDQLLFMRPVAGCGRHAMPVPGLYLCGAGTHPGPGLTGLSGLLAARAALPR
ncbi:MAG: NAD(P)/FAD-dependent oxidoreductase [Steroidobacteraceae bacterium]|nr:NAD(P)/FAD-dependent oxidoreductase [Steroidobacteraceae bacterium]